MPDSRRTTTLDDALLRAQRECRRLGLTINLGRLTAGTSEVPFVRLCTAGGREVISGFGKGEGLERQVSAHFEALERFYVSHSVLRERTAQQLRLMTSAEVRGQEALAQDVLISRWADKFPASTAGCVRYRRQDDSVWYPAFLTDPRYPSHKLEGDSFDEYRTLFRYSSGLGTGASTSRVDATLHALSELIEHDSLSIALLHWFILQDHDVRAVRNQSLPNQLAGLLQEASLVTGTSVRLLDITSELAIPSYLAVSEPAPEQPALVGMGASPIATHAAYRALDELTQSVAFSQLPATDNPIRRLAAWPVLQQCGYLHISRIKGGSVTEVDLRPSLSVDAPEAALNALITTLKRQGFECYFRDLAASDSEISVVAALVPGLERFSLVRLGVPVLPNGRGWRLWPSPSRPDRQAKNADLAPSAPRPQNAPMMPDA
jgi:ribosomal protein S12 methylthiotransferase accessory factor